VRRDVVEVNQDVTAGRSRQPQHRALTPCERMHADKMLSFEELEAAQTLRHRLLKELGASEGVVGTTDEEGRKVFDTALAVAVCRAAVEVVDAVTLGQIGAQLSLYRGEKQTQAAGGTMVRQALRRGAAHLAFLRWPEFNPATSWDVLPTGAR
jgi:hypothetical protein